MIISREVENMCVVKQGVHHGAAPIPEEAKWVKAKEVKDISGFTHGIGWCAPQQGACKLSLNVKEGIIQEALVETIGCSGMTHSAAMAAEVLPGLTVMEALNTDLVCDAINTAMRELFLQIVYGRSQSAFSEEGLPVGQVWRILVRDFVLRLVPCTVLCRRDLVTWRWQKAMLPVLLWMRKTTSSVISL
jgi:NifU-like protein involved in Fe-S cluster formation